MITKRINRPEQDMQIAIFKRIHAENRLDGLQRVPLRFWAFHVPNGGFRRDREAIKLKAMGTKKGVADIVLMLRGGKAVFIELKHHEGWKRDPNREVTPWDVLEDSQKDFKGIVEGLGFSWYLLAAGSPKDGVDKFIEILKREGVAI